ncbi:MAG: hypothetical protein R6X35_12070 [Candidatus Krumholzibacteriia bacterium]
MKKLLLLALVLTLPASALAQQRTDCYGWENGETILGSYNTEYLYVANSTEHAYEGTRSLEVRETGGTTTPQAWVAWLPEVALGDVVTATIQTWDTTPTASPSVRIWASWTQPGGAITSYAGSADGSPDYSGGADWVELSWTWTVGAVDAGKGLLIQIRPYGGGDFTESSWVDHLCVTHPVSTRLEFPGVTFVGNENGSWGHVKGLYR